MEKILVRSKNQYDINCNFYVNDNNKKIYIFLHGLGGYQKMPAVLKVIDALKELNIGAITFDFVGHGESEVDFKNFSIQKCIDDLNDVLSYVVKKYPTKKIGLFGTSLGAHIILRNLSQNTLQVDSLILKSPAINIFNAIQNLKPYFNIKKDSNSFVLPLLKDFKIDINKMLDFKKSSDILFQSQKNISTKTLIVQGKKDDIAPYETVIDFIEKNLANCALKLFKNADHNFLNEGEIETVCEYVKSFEKNLKKQDFNVYEIGEKI